jgi:hypothetical protein
MKHVGRLMTGLLVLVAVAVSTAIAWAFTAGGLSATGAHFAIAVGAVAALVTAWFTQDENASTLTAWDVLLLVLFALASLRSFIWLIYSVGDEWRVLSPNNLGDISIHIQFIRYLASGVGFWPESPILSGSPLVYPLGMDLWNSLLLLSGLPVERGLIWTGLIGAALTAWSLWRWGGAFAIAALLFNGGIAGFAFFSTGMIMDFQSELAWKNLFLTMFVTQRGLLYALPCGLLLLRTWREDFFGNGSGIPRVVPFFLYVTLPFFSAHAFLALSFILAGIFVFQPTSRRSLFIFVGGAILPASGAIYLVTGGFSATSGLRWLPGWMQADGGIHFWILNFGISLPLLLILLAVVAIRGDARARSFCFPALGIFATCFLFAIAPWEWDNTKMLIWAWLVCAPFLWERLFAPLPKLFSVILCSVLFASGALSLIGGLDGRHGYKLITRSELAATEIALQNVPRGSRIAVDPDFNNPVMLLGWPVSCGYEGHLWSHGLDYKAKWIKLQNILSSRPGWKVDADNLNTHWVFRKGGKLESVKDGESDEKQTH